MKIAIIPARGGSKRVKNKNIKNFFGKPIISYSIDTAKKSKLFDKIIVSSDSKKIIKIAKRYGAETPFIRPKNLARANSSTISVVKHAIKWLLKNKIKPKYICCIYPTAPLMEKNDLKKSFKILNNKTNEFVISVSQYSYPVRKSFFIKKNRIQTIKFFNYSKLSQNLKLAFHDAGQFYWGATRTWLKKKNILNKNSYIFKLPQLRVQDIDSTDDWEIAKKLFILKKIKF